MGIGHRVGNVVRTPLFGIVVLTPIVLAGAAAATPSRLVQPGKPTAEQTSMQAIVAAAPSVDTTGMAVVPMPKAPADFRFAANMLSLPPPSAVITSSGGMRIPAMALAAYRKAEQTMAVAAPGCGVSWNLLAGIGRIESSHANGGNTDISGTAVRPIFGPVLDGSLPGNEVIVQGNSGGRPVYARAMGPMQFLPGTWSRFASDGDGDGKSDPQNVFDAALGAARYLCSGGLDLRNQAQVLTAILRYNNSMAYAQNVLGWAAAYATGVAPLDLPPISGPVPALGDGHLERPGQGLGPDLPPLPSGDPLALLALNMGNSQTARQMLPGPLPGPPGEGIGPAHGCEVICMASQLAPSRAPAPDLPPWLAPPPWLAGPPPGFAPPSGPLPGMPPAPGPALPAAALPGAPLPALTAEAPALPAPGLPPASGPAPGPAPGPAAEAPAIVAPPIMAPPIVAPPVVGAPAVGPPPGPA